MTDADLKTHARTIKQCEALIEPLSAADYYRWGYSLLKVGQFRDACQVLTRALKHYPDDPDRNEFLSYLGQAHFQLGEYDQAISSFRSSISHFPKSPDTHVFLGDALRMVGQCKEATDVYRTALKLALPGEDAALRAARGLEMIKRKSSKK